MSQQPVARRRVFLCHSSGDKTAVRNLYERLKADGFQPWIDQEDLLGGQAWEIEIPRAVKASDVVIVCLSPDAVSKRGFFQKEIKLALDTADELPEGTIFVIPLKLEECNLPERLSHLHSVDYYKLDGYQRLVRSLNTSFTPSVSGSLQAPVATALPPDINASPSPNAKPESTFGKKIIFSAGFLALAAAFGIGYIYHLGRNDKSFDAQEPSTRGGFGHSSELTRSSISFQEFVKNVYDDVRTNLQRAEFLRSHLGSRVTWTGWVRSVTDNRKAGISMLLSPESGSDSRFLAVLSFPQSDRSALLSLGLGQKATVECTLADFGFNAQLNECRLVTVWPAELPSTQAANFSPITFQGFVKFFLNEPHTQIQQDDLRKSLLRSRVVWTGWVGNVSVAERENGISVSCPLTENFLP